MELPIDEKGFDLAHIVSTKIRVPGASEHALRRARLLDRLHRARRQQRIFWLCAPAGFGKSTLLAQFLDGVKDPVLWYSLDPTDTLETFLDHMAQACGSLPGAPPLLTREAWLSWLSQRCQPLWVVFDDLHMVSDPELSQLLERTLLRASSSVYLLWSSRREASFSLGRWRAASELLELRAEDLRLDREELGLLVERLAGHLGSQEVERLEALTEGWPAAVVLILQAGPSWQSRLLDAPFGLSRTPEALRDYLLREVFASYTEEERSALLVLSLFDRFSPEFAVDLGLRASFWDWTDRWFLVALESEVGWFRFHHLFALFLRSRTLQEMTSEQREECYRRASSWFEGRRLYDEAVVYSLQGRAWNRAGALLKEEFSLGQLVNLYKRSKAWFRALPAKEMDPSLCCRFAVVLWAALRYREAYTMFEQGLDPECPEVEFLSLAGLTICCDALGLRRKRDYWYGRAVQAVPQELSAARTIGLYFLAGLSVFSCGEAFQGERLIEGGESGRVLEDREFPVFFDGVPGMVALLRGRLEEAREHFEQSRQLSQRWGHSAFVRVAAACSACCAYEAGQLEQALEGWELFFEADDTPPADALWRVFLPRYVKTLRALGRQEAEQVLTQHGDGAPEVRDMLMLDRMLEAGRWAEAEALLGRYKVSLTVASYDFPRHLVYRGWIQWWLAAEQRGEDCPDRVDDWMEVIAERAAQGGRLREMVEAKLWQARRCLLRSAEAEAERLVSEALQLGRPSGLVAVYLEQPAELRRLCLAQDSSLAEDGGQWRLVAALSSRESEILELIGQGATNRHIASVCFLSLNTVKWYNQRIYKKLGVTSREEALGWLQASRRSSSG